METIKLLNGPTLVFYTISEKKPDDWSSVIYIVNYEPSPMCAMHRGHYRKFKNALGRFVSKNYGSHQEQHIIYWADALSAIP